MYIGGTIPRHCPLDGVEVGCLILHRLNWCTGSPAGEEDVGIPDSGHRSPDTGIT